MQPSRGSRRADGEARTVLAASGTRIGSGGRADRRSQICRGRHLPADRIEGRGKYRFAIEPWKRPPLSPAVTPILAFAAMLVSPGLRHDGGASSDPEGRSHAARPAACRCTSARLVPPAGSLNSLDPYHATRGLPFIVQRNGLAMVALKWAMNPTKSASVRLSPTMPQTLPVATSNAAIRAFVPCRIYSNSRRSTCPGSAVLNASGWHFLPRHVRPERVLYATAAEFRRSAAPPC